MDSALHKDMNFKQLKVINEEVEAKLPSFSEFKLIVVEWLTSRCHLKNWTEHLSHFVLFHPSKETCDKDTSNECYCFWSDY